MQTDSAVALPEPRTVDRAIEVWLRPPEVQGGIRGEVETSGLVTVLLERGLADLDPVVPRVGEAPPGPGLARALLAAERWTGDIAVLVRSGQVEVELTLCDHAMSCRGQRAIAPASTPWLATAELLRWSTAILGAGPSPGAAKRWDVPVSSDSYAVLMHGRSAAVFYGLREPVTVEIEGDVRRDPIARAVFIDPGMAEAQWIRGRRHAQRGRWTEAREAFSRAALVARDSPTLRADESAAIAGQGKWREATSAWEVIERVAPGDPRFQLPRAEAALYAGDAAHADRILRAAHAEREGQPEIIALRYAVAEALEPAADHDGLLARWQRAAPLDPEPVRRRVANRVRRGDYRAAWELLPLLAERGAVAEADAQTLGLGVALSEWEGAADAAERLGQPHTAQRIRARGALEVDPAAMPPLDGDPLARVVAGRAALAGGRPADALTAADAALRQRRWMPEAWALRADALDATDRPREAERARETLRSVDPAWPDGA